MKIIVCVKQVPDAKDVRLDPETNTLAREGVQSIMNPYDQHAVEEAVRLKEKLGGDVTVLSMGPPQAVDVLKQAISCGADHAVLVSDRAFAGADTWATSYTLAKAVNKIGTFDLILCGKQAIDGDTAQVGPQAAEKIGIPQITYAEEFLGLDGNKIKVKRRLERGVEVVEAACPVLLTVHSSAPDCRVRNAKRMMKFKHAKTDIELQELSEDYMELMQNRPYLKIDQWSVEDLGADVSFLGLSGSPTKVKKIESVVFTQKESKTLSDSDRDINSLMKTLINSHVLG